MDNILQSYSVIELLHRGTEYLKACGVTEPRAEADILLAHVLGISRDRLYLERDLEVKYQAKERFAELLSGRGNREPMAYLLKTREFMGLRFFVDQRVLIPRPETEILAERILEIGGKRTDYKFGNILDLCTGSGALAITLAKNWPEATVAAVDISLEALAVAAFNADRMQVRIDFHHGDLFYPVINQKFDVIVSNPPYVSPEEYAQCLPEVKKEPKLALLGGSDGLEFYRRIAADAEKVLSAKGIILMEIGFSQGKMVRELFEKSGFKTVIISDYAGLDRIVQAEKE